jgi:hypothetical protein
MFVSLLTLPRPSQGPASPENFLKSSATFPPPESPPRMTRLELHARDVEPIEDAQLRYLCEAGSQSKYCALWPDRGDPIVTRTWSFDELLGFLNDLESFWRRTHSGRWREPSSEYPNVCFHFPIESTILDQRTYARGIHVHIPSRCTRCSVTASKQFIGNRAVEWVRAKCHCANALGASLAM